MKIFITLLLLLLPLNIKAAECSDAQVKNYQKLIKQIQVTYDYYDEQKDDLKFIASFHNVQKDFYLVNYNDFKYTIVYKEIKDGVITVGDLTPGQTYRFSVLNNDNKCKSQILDTITIQVPHYNAYYKDPLCVGIEEFEWCKKWVNVNNVSYKTFQKESESYKLEKENSLIEPEPVVEPDIWQQLRNFIGNYYIYIVGVIVVVASVIVIIVKRRKDKTFKF